MIPGAYRRAITRLALQREPRGISTAEAQALRHREQAPEPVALAAVEGAHLQALRRPRASPPC